MNIIRPPVWKDYKDRVLKLAPIAYWMMDEASGGVSYDSSVYSPSNERDGAYTGVTLGQVGIGDGRTSPLFDGVNDYNDVYSISLRDAFNGGEGTVAFWIKVSGAGVWTDGTLRRLFYWAVDGDNRVYAQKLAAPDDEIAFFYEANNVTESISKGSLSTLDWVHWAITWSAVADQVKLFFAGAQEGATQDTLGAWAGNLAVGAVIIGAFDTTPQLVWDGYIAHFAVWDYSLTPAQVADLAVVL